MGKVSPKVRAFRRRAKPSAIMSAKTFDKIKRSAAARGYRNPAAAAGRAYWNAAKRRAAGKPKGKK